VKPRPGVYVLSFEPWQWLMVTRLAWMAHRSLDLGVSPGFDGLKEPIITCILMS